MLAMVWSRLKLYLCMYCGILCCGRGVARWRCAEAVLVTMVEGSMLHC